jgi:hypothetical protein
LELIHSRVQSQAYDIPITPRQRRGRRGQLIAFRAN